MWQYVAIYFPNSTTHIADSVHIAADILSKLELKVTTTARLKIWEEVQTPSIEVQKSCLDVANEEQFFFTHADKDNESEEQTFQRKEQTWQDSKERIANEGPSKLKFLLSEFSKIDGINKLLSIIGIKTNAQIKV